MKCLQYWPLTIGAVVTFEECKISLKSTETWSDLSTSQLVVSKVKVLNSTLYFFYKLNIFGNLDSMSLSLVKLLRRSTIIWNIWLKKHWTSQYEMHKTVFFYLSLYLLRCSVKKNVKKVTCYKIVVIARLFDNMR